MAELAFKVRADYDEVVSMREELARLRDEMMKVDVETEEGRSKMVQLEHQYYSVSRQLDSLVESAAAAAVEMKDGMVGADDAVIRLMSTIRTGESEVHGVFASLAGQVEAVTGALEEAQSVSGELLDDMVEKMQTLVRERNLAEARGDSGRVEELEEEIEALEENIEGQKTIQSVMRDTSEEVTNQVEAIREAIEAYEDLADEQGNVSELTEEQADEMRESLASALREVMDRMEAFQSKSADVSTALENLRRFAKEYKSESADMATVTKRVTDEQGKLNASLVELAKNLAKMILPAKAAKVVLAALGGAWGVAAISLATMLIGKLIAKYKETKREAEELAEAQAELSEAVAKGAAKPIAAYEEMRRKWTALGDEMEKRKFLDENAKALERLGLRVEGVDQAEALFISHTQEYWDAQITRAKADLYRAKVQGAIEKQIELEDTIEQNRGGERKKKIKLKNGRFTDLSGQEHFANDELGKLLFPDRKGTDTSEFEWVNEEAYNATLQLYELTKNGGELDQLKEKFDDATKASDAANESLKEGTQIDVNYRAHANELKSEWEAAKKTYEDVKKDTASTKKQVDEAKKKMDESAAAYKSWTGESPEEKKKSSGTAKKTDDDKELRERERAYEQYGKQILAMIRSVEDDIEREQISAMDDRNAAVLKRLDMEKRMLLEKAGEVGEAMTGLFEGNVDLLNRVKIPVADLADAGWEDAGVSREMIEETERELEAVVAEMADLPDVTDHPEVRERLDALMARETELKDRLAAFMAEREELLDPKNYATLFSSQEGIADGKGKVHEILYTPILKDGTVLSPDALADYLHGVLEGSEDILEADRVENGGMGLVIAVDVDEKDGEKLHEMQEAYYELVRLIEEYDAMRRADAEKERLGAEERSMNDFLKEYGTFEEKKLAIAKDYEERIAKASTEGERLALARMRESDLRELERNYDLRYSLIFASVGGMSDNLLSDAVEATQKAIEDAKDSGDVEALAELYAHLREQMTEVGERKRGWGFRGIAEGFGLRAKAEEQREQADEMEKSLSVREAAIGVMSAIGASGEEIEEARRKVGELRVEIDRLREDATQNDENALGFLKRGFDEVTSAFSQLGSAMSSFGDGLGGAMDAVADLGRGLSGLASHADEVREAISGEMKSGDAWSTVVSGTIELLAMVGKSIQNNRRAQEEWNRAIEDADHAYRMLQLDKLDYEPSNVFGVEDPFKKAAAGAERYRKAMEEVSGLTDKLSEGKVQTGTKKVVDWGNVGKGAGAGAAVGAALGTIVPVLGNGIGAAIGAAVGAIAGALSTKVVPVFENLKDRYGYIFDPDTFELNERILADYKMLDEDTKQIVDHWDDIKKKAEEARNELKDNLKEFTGDLGKKLEDTLVEAWKSRRLYSAVDDYKRYVGEQIASILEQQAFSSVFESLFDDLGKRMEDSFLGPDADNSVIDDLDDFNQKFPQYLEAYGQLMDQLNGELEEMGYDGFRERRTNADATTGSFQQISETTGSAIMGGVTALRLSSEVRNQHLAILTQNMTEMLRQQALSTTLAEDIRGIQVDSYMALIAIRDRASESVAELRGIRGLAEQIERKTREL